MNHERLLSIAGWAAAFGGLAWLAKIAVIAGTDGRVTNTGAAAVLFLLGLALLAVGGAVATLVPARGRGPVAHAAALLLGPVVFWLSFMLFEPAAEAIVGDSGPGWLGDEAGIAATGAIWLLIGIASLRGRAQRRPVAGLGTPR